MSLNIPKLKESNNFLKILFENLTSVILLANKELKVTNVNDSFEALYSVKREWVTGRMCGEVLGCRYIFDENAPCGETSHCKKCVLRNSIYEAFNKHSSVSKQFLSRDFQIGNSFIKKDFQFTARYVMLHDEEYVVIIIDDVSEIVHHKRVVEQKNKEITDSIEYAKIIQKNLFPFDNILSILFPDSFLFFQPKDIISGDFYWLFRTQDTVYCAVADCTGHGVPGAMLSVLGISFLDRIICEMGQVSPAQILDRLRELIIEVFNQQGEQDEIKDGMDIVLIAMDMRTYECQYSGANNSLYIIRNSTHNAYLEEIKSDRMPISIYYEMKPFTNHSFQLQKGDILYLKTDGFEDQIGGALNKKYLRKQLKAFLSSIHKYPFDIQKELLINEFSKWKGKLDQTDDVMMLGIKV